MRRALLLLGFLVFGIFFFRFHSFPASGDFYWHLATGRAIFAEQKILTTDNFTYAVADPTYLPTEWLFQVVYFALYKSIGFLGLHLLRVLLGLAILALLYKSFRLITANLFLTLSGLAILAYILAFRLNDRPEMFSYLFLVIVNYVFAAVFIKRSVPKLFYLLPLLFLLWPNMHPYGIFGWAILGFWTVFLLAGKKLEKIREKQKIAVIFGLSTGVFLLQYERVFYFLKAGDLSNPELSSLFVRVATIKTFHFWQQIPFDIYLSAFSFFLMLFILAVLLLTKRLKKDMVVVVLFYLAIVVSAFGFFRLLPVALLLVFPWLLYLLVAWDGNKWNRPGSLCWYSQSLVVGLLIVFSTGAGYLAGDRTFSLYYLDESKKPVAVKNRTWLAEYPVSAASFIRDNLDSKRVYSIVNWNNYLIWSIPDIKVFRTAQPEYLTKTAEKDEELLRLGLANWSGLVDKYQIDTVVNTYGDQFRTSRLPVLSLKDWRLVYADEVSAVYARDGVIKKRVGDLSRINLQAESLVKFSLKDGQIVQKQLEGLLGYDPRNSFAREQLILFYLLSKDLDRAKQMTEESLQLLPRDPVFSVFLSTIYANQNQCDAARSYARQAQADSFGDYRIAQRAEAVLVAKCGEDGLGEIGGDKGE